ncbi:uncharacterized protein [Miscanthus floridulus]|uniref:uncharacterized protein isoform X1 n=1 Tax=Miscanthus floridulus TaxID=154761 RepID=UPI00345968E0
MWYCVCLFQCTARKCFITLHTLAASSTSSCSSPQAATIWWTLVTHLSQGTWVLSEIQDGQDKGCFDCSWYNIFAYKNSFSQKLWSKKEILDRYLDVDLKGNKDGLKKLRLRIEDPPRRKHMVYLDAPECWITTQEYQEEGVACLRKCGQSNSPILLATYHPIPA